MQGHDLAEEIPTGQAGEILLASHEMRIQKEGLIVAVQTGRKEDRGLKCLRQPAINAK